MKNALFLMISMKKKVNIRNTGKDNFTSNTRLF